MVTIRYINQDLGSIEGRRENPQWIATALGVAGGLASSLIGGSKAEEAAREAERRQRIAENKPFSDYDSKMLRELVRLFHSEFSVSLGIPYSDVEQFIYRRTGIKVLY